MTERSTRIGQYAVAYDDRNGHIKDMSEQPTIPHPAMTNNNNGDRMKLQELTSSQVANNQYHALFNDFQWDVPERFNIADVCCRRWSHEQKQIAIFYEDSTGNCRKLTYRHLYQQANQLSNLLRQQGVQRGDVVACIMPQRPEMAVTMMACLQMGAIVMPLSHLFGPEALEYRLRHS